MCNIKSKTKTCLPTKNYRRMSACITPQAWLFCNGEVFNLYLRNIPVKFGKNPVNSF